MPNASMRLTRRIMKMNPFRPIRAVALISMLALAGSRTAAAPLPNGFGKIEVGTRANAITVFTYKPRDYTDGPLVIVFHGMLRNADWYCTNAAPLAVRFHVLIAAPCFD